MTEEQGSWVNRLRRREPQALRAFVSDHGEAVRRYLLGIVRSPADAEELAQDALVRFLGALDGFRGDASPKTFLFRIAHNLAVNHVKSASRRYETTLDALLEIPGPGGETHDHLESTERSQRLREALQHLPLRQRTVVVLKTWEDMTFREISEVLELAEGTVKAHYFFGLRGLRKLLEDSRDTR
ncbi:MAG: RNA polymerase sigma factor [Acidobacteriota bacterium]|jgi:RNA polymerase sigma-70 factor, ECF subfamily